MRRSAVPQARCECPVEVVRIASEHVALGRVMASAKQKNRRADLCTSGLIRQVTWRNSHQEVRGPPVPNRRRLASRNALPLLLGRFLRGLLRNLLGLLSCLSHCLPSLESVRISPDKKIMSKRARLVDC
jgi:chorismate-pyruvate lyase